MVIGQVEHPLEWGHWAEAHDVLDPALALSDLDWPQVIDELSAGTMQLIGVMQAEKPIAFAITRFVNSRDELVLEIFICGGKGFREWAGDLAEAVAAAAQRAGCIAVRTWGRPGWRNVLAPLGWKTDVLCFERRMPAAA